MPRRPVRTFLNMVVVPRVVPCRAAPWRVAPCHLQVSGTGGSCSIEANNLMRGQDPAPVDKPLLSSNKPLVTLRWVTPRWLTSPCSSQAARAATAVARPNRSSGASRPRQPSVRMALVDTRVKPGVNASRPRFRLARPIFMTCPVVYKGAFLDSTLSEHAICYMFMLISRNLLSIYVHKKRCEGDAWL